MPRKREFDPEETLEKAMRLFWRKGYAETSMRDLIAYTGVAHAGLYSVFDSKQGLFKSSLDLYRDTLIAKLLGNLESSDSGRREIEQFFAWVLYLVKNGPFKDGCLMCNTAIEFGDEPGEILDSVNAHMVRLGTAFREALERAKERGEVIAGLDPLATADYLVSIYNGIMVMARCKMKYEQIDRSTRIAMLAFG